MEKSLEIARISKLYEFDVYTFQLSCVCDLCVHCSQIWLNARFMVTLFVFFMVLCECIYRVHSPFAPRQIPPVKLGAFAFTHSDFHQLHLEILWSRAAKNHFTTEQQSSEKGSRKKHATTQIKIASNLLCWFDCVLHYVLFSSSLSAGTWFFFLCWAWAPPSAN